ncbi:hypothetical protein AV530_003611 [Patagioenas fasciata monilis]|uniref:Uncharacterized protein n=1 Tax=Patagioenas fasciata monilis TaxID=372326 RepID=A0A1V4KYM4_PATFA|nr:hypothetical protein AV530_003611 [Patagioenas fasciata monilis]
MIGKRNTLVCWAKRFLKCSINRLRKRNCLLPGRASSPAEGLILKDERIRAGDVARCRATFLECVSSGRKEITALFYGCH